MSVSQIEFPIKTPQEFNLDKVMQAVTVLQEAAAGQELLHPHAEVKIATTRPVLLSIFSDLHIGDAHSDYPTMLDHLKMVRDQPEAYACFIGDEVNLMTFKNLARQELLPHELQGLLAFRMLQELDALGKIAFVGTGNHNDFRDGFYREFFDSLRAPLIGPNMGTVNLTVGEQLYRIFEFHKLSMGNSSMSPLLRQRRAQEFLSPDADIYIGAHTHRKALAVEMLGGLRGTASEPKLRVLVEAGSYKLADGFQWSQGNVRMRGFDYGGTSVMLYPHEHRMVPYYDIAEGIRALRVDQKMREILGKKAGELLGK